MRLGWEVVFEHSVTSIWILFIIEKQEKEIEISTKALSLASVLLRKHPNNRKSLVSVSNRLDTLLGKK
jgi:hypothetical protein